MSSQVLENAPSVGWPCTIFSSLRKSIWVLTLGSQGLGTSNERLAYGDHLAKLGRHHDPITARSQWPCHAHRCLQSSTRRHPPTIRKRRTILAILYSRGYHLIEPLFLIQVTGSTPKFAFTVPVSPKCFCIPPPGCLCLLCFRLTLLTLRRSSGRSEPRTLDPLLPAPTLPSIGIWARHPSISQSLSAHPPRLVPLLRPHTETEMETVEATAAVPHRRCPRGTK